MKGSYHIKIKELHEKYGPVVRIGPNTLDFDIPELIKTIYGTDGKWRKVRSFTSPCHDSLHGLIALVPDRVLPQ